jgi:hypothetical protein
MDNVWKSNVTRSHNHSLHVNATMLSVCVLELCVTVNNIKY